MVETRVRGKPVKLDYVADIDEVERRGIYRVSLDGEVIASGACATLDACRVLHGRGLSGMIGFCHADGMIGLVTSIRWGAAHTCKDGSFVKWQEKATAGPQNASEPSRGHPEPEAP